MKKQRAKNPNRVKAAKKAAKKRLRVEGKFIPKEVANDLRIFATRAKIPVNEYIRKNKEDIIVYINDKSITGNYRTDSLITLINNHIGKVETIGYDYKGNHKLFRDLQEFKRNLINRKGVNVADIYFTVKIMMKGKKLIIDLSEMKQIENMKSKDIEGKEFRNITIIDSPKKKKKVKGKAKAKFIKPTKARGKKNSKR